MYLFTFIFLLITILGLFTQVYALQSARVMGNQQVIGQQMAAWHAGAITVARANPSLGATLSGCRLSPGATLHSGLTLTSACSTQIASSDLPQGHPNPITGQIRWESIVYTGNGARMVATFVPPGATTDTPLPPSGATLTDLLRQLMKIKSIDQSVATASGACLSAKLVAMVQPNTAQVIEYPVPRDVAGTVCYVPTKSVAIVTVIN